MTVQGFFFRAGQHALDAGFEHERTSATAVTPCAVNKPMNFSME